MNTLAPAKSDTKPRLERPISKRVRQAIALLLSGECTTQKAAAQRVKLSPERLCRALKETRTQAFVERETASKLNGLQMKAAVGAENLLEARSEHVRAEMVKHLLSIGGHIAKTASNPLVSINISPGYIIDLSGSPSPGALPSSNIGPGGGVVYEHEAPMIDVTPERSK